MDPAWHAVLVLFTSVQCYVLLLTLSGRATWSHVLCNCSRGRAM